MKVLIVILSLLFCSQVMRAECADEPPMMPTAVVTASLELVSRPDPQSADKSFKVALVIHATQRGCLALAVLTIQGKPIKEATILGPSEMQTAKPKLSDMGIAHLTFMVLQPFPKGESRTIFLFPHDLNYVGLGVDAVMWTPSRENLWRPALVENASLGTFIGIPLRVSTKGLTPVSRHHKKKRRH